MELNLRTVLVVIGSVVMLAILVDGFRRMRRARQEALSLDVQEDYTFPDGGFPSELPNGGARVVGDNTGSYSDTELDDVFSTPLETEFTDAFDSHSFDAINDDVIINKDDSLTALDDSEEDLDDPFDSPLDSPADVTHDAISDIDNDVISDVDEIVDTLVEERVPDFESTLGTNSGSNSGSKSDFNVSSKFELSEQVIPKSPDFNELNLDMQVPLLMDVKDLGEEIVQITPADSPTLSEMLAVEEPHTSLDENIIEEIELTVNDIEGIEASVEAISGFLNPDKAPDKELDKKLEDTPSKTEKERFDEAQQKVKDIKSKTAQTPVKQPGPHAENLATRSITDVVLVMHVIPHDERGFSGEDILFLVNSCDLRYGDKGIFHRFESENGNGKIQFSMANSINPGTFDLNTLINERIHGLSLFMSLPGPKKAMDAFEVMTEMASMIARKLGGEVHDETHSIMALQTVEHNRQQVRDFVRRQKLPRKK